VALRLVLRDLHGLGEARLRARVAHLGGLLGRLGRPPGAGARPAAQADGEADRSEHGAEDEDEPHGHERGRLQLVVAHAVQHGLVAAVGGDEDRARDHEHGAVRRRLAAAGAGVADRLLAQRLPAVLGPQRGRQLGRLLPVVG
jgi:hypothetical protein